MLRVPEHPEKSWEDLEAELKPDRLFYAPGATEADRDLYAIERCEKVNRESKKRQVRNYTKYGSMKIVNLAEIIAKFADYFRVDRLKESAALYAEIYAGDAELQELAECRQTPTIYCG
jgi:hypothetical protein